MRSPRRSRYAADDLQKQVRDTPLNSLRKRNPAWSTIFQSGFCIRKDLCCEKITRDALMCEAGDRDTNISHSMIISRPVVGLVSSPLHGQQRLYMSCIWTSPALPEFYHTASVLQCASFVKPMLKLQVYLDEAMRKTLTF